MLKSLEQVHGAVETVLWFIHAGSKPSIVHEVVEALQTDGPEKVDVLMAVAMIGLVLGAATWIGWEVMRFVARLVGSIAGVAKHGESNGVSRKLR